MLSRLPKVDIMLSAVDNLNDKTVSQDNLQSLIKNWPNEQFDLLMNEADENPEEKWDKTESYFIKLGSKKNFYLRINIWLFKLQFEMQIKGLMSQQDTVLNAFEQILSNDYLRQIFGSLLKIGNCMNAGNKTRG